MMIIAFLGISIVFFKDHAMEILGLQRHVVIIDKSKTQLTNMYSGITRYNIYDIYNTYYVFINMYLMFYIEGCFTS